ncbi:MAG: hypothetical protein OXU76_02260, partial [Alphaproteobacteria bacterium]|nr:hypothetical protein [Alphaproteobacteria bacterium]
KQDKKHIFSPFLVTKTKTAREPATAHVPGCVLIKPNWNNPHLFPWWYFIGWATRQRVAWFD